MMKQVLVVGGSGRLGSALVGQLLDQRTQVVVAGRTRPDDSRVQHSYVIDANSVEWHSFYTAVEKDTGTPIDGAVFVAGTAAFGRTTWFSPETARSILELNFWACVTAAGKIADYWSESGRAGTFVAVLSVAGRRAVPFEAYYSASKAAAARFLECLDLEYASKGIRFLPAFPGALNTPFRERAQWYGMKPASADQTTDVRTAARAIEKLLTGNRRARVIGWRERVIDIADRVTPGLYDRAILRRRVSRVLDQ
jgi:short-subunit dehydrogenase